MNFIEVADIDLIYGNRSGAGDGTGTLALSKANLSVDRNEFVALVGPSGCGKSTLLKLVSGLVKSSQGSVYVDGAEVTKPLKNVGMAFQNATLLPWRNIRDNVLLPLEIVEPYRSEPKQRTKACTRRRIAGDRGIGGVRRPHAMAAFRRHATAGPALPRANSQPLDPPAR